MQHPNEDLMRQCIENAKKAADAGQYALGTIVVDRNGQILSSQYSKLITDHDPTAHPEIVAIREAATILKSRYLFGCFLYTTLEPCPMCTAAAIWAKMEGIVFGALQEDAEAFCAKHSSGVFTWRSISVPSKHIVDHGIPRLQLFPGVFRDECKTLFRLPEIP